MGHGGEGKPDIVAGGARRPPLGEETAIADEN